MPVSLLTPDHTPAYRDLMLEAYAGAPDAYTATAEERAAEPDSWWRQRVADPAGSTLCWGAFDDGDTLVGSVALEFGTRPKARHKALLIGMYVQPAARGRGLGDALLRAALQAAQARDGIRVVNLTVTEGNAAAIALYRRHGFVAWGTEPRAIASGDGFKAKVHMALPLRDAGGLRP
jgi:ribosomal protein S18 acetylase RimI-like enzyme